MTLSEYLEICLSTWAKRDAGDRLRNAALGIAGEAGEIIEVVKKSLYHGKLSDECRVLAQGEIGDLFYYIIVYSHERGWLPAALAKIIGAENEDWASIQSAVKRQAGNEDIFTLAMQLSAVSGKISSFTINHISNGDKDSSESMSRLEEVSARLSLAGALYAAIEIANRFGLNAEEIALYNTSKLKARHPNGWQVL
jgi:hypothetical protein